nr:xyloside xylosyltransferase 1 [Anolis sagrei ordinatus]
MAPCGLPRPCVLAAAASLAVALGLYYAGGGPSPPPPPSPPVHVGCVLARAEGRAGGLVGRAGAALRSLARKGAPPPGPALVLHLLTDAPSREVAARLAREALRGAPFPHQCAVLPPPLPPLPWPLSFSSPPPPTPMRRHLFWQFRKENPGTRVGDPPPEGLPGFNSGVLLLDLAAMRGSGLYNSLLEEGALRALAQRYHFRGHLGDQDFFTLAGMEHPALFHRLPCAWNRQLCTWWRLHGYEGVFEQYFRCDQGPVKLYHGNCNTPIPQEGG